MTNQLTQAELMQIADAAGLTGLLTNKSYMDIHTGADAETQLYGGNREALAKFAQLIQQRQSVDTPQLVAQALEKAAQYVDGMASDEDGRVILTKSTISVGIRALIDQPVEQ